MQPFLTPPLRAADLSIQTKVNIFLYYQMLKLISFIKNFLGLNGIKIFCKWKQLDIGTNKYLAVSQPSVSRCVNEVASALNDPQIFNGYIKFPNNF